MSNERYDERGKFEWSGDDIVVTPSPSTERYILAAAAAGAIKKAASMEVGFFVGEGYLDEKTFELTDKGETRLKELLKQTREQEARRFVLSLASLQGIESTGPIVEELIKEGLINKKDYSITTKGQRELARLSGLELTDKEP